MCSKLTIKILEGGIELIFAQICLILEVEFGHNPLVFSLSFSTSGDS